MSPMIFLMQFGVNKHLRSFQRLQNALALRPWVIFFLGFEKFARAYLFQIALEIIWLPTQTNFCPLDQQLSVYCYIQSVKWYIKEITLIIAQVWKGYITFAQELISLHVGNTLFMVLIKLLT